MARTASEWVRFQRHGSSCGSSSRRPAWSRRVPMAASSMRNPRASAARKSAFGRAPDSITGLGPVTVLGADADEEAVFLLAQCAAALAVELLEDLVHPAFLGR